MGCKGGKAFTDGRKTGSITGEKRNELNRLNSLLEALEEKAKSAYRKNVDSYGLYHLNHQECRHWKVRGQGNVAVIV